MRKACPSRSTRGVARKKVRCLTTLGRVEVREQTWRAGTKNLRPLLTKLGVAARGYSRRLQRVFIDFGADETFAAAAAKVREYYGLEVNSEPVRRVRLKHSERIAIRVKTKPLTTLASRGPDWIVAEADGTLLPICRHCQCDTGNGLAQASANQLSGNPGGGGPGGGRDYYASRRDLG